MIPVFLFTGFLGSGKTTFINDLLESGGLARVRTLAVLTERGEAELEIPARYGGLITVCHVRDRNALTREWLAQMQADAGAGQILIEYNGMWPLADLFAVFPKGWMLYSAMLIADSEQFRFYNMNMRDRTADKLRACTMAMFNRVREGSASPDLRRLVRALNRKAEIYYEYASGECEKDESGDDLPYDINADTIIVDDEAFAVWQLDLHSFPDRYEGKTVKVKAQVFSGPMAGRRVMTCCEADIELIMFQALDEQQLLPEAGCWASMTAEVVLSGQTVRLKIISAEKASAPEPEIAVF